MSHLDAQGGGRLGRTHQRAVDREVRVSLVAEQPSQGAQRSEGAGKAYLGRKEVTMRNRLLCLAATVILAGGAACERDDAREAGRAVGGAAQQVKEGAAEFGEGIREGAHEEAADGDERRR